MNMDTNNVQIAHVISYGQHDILVGVTKLNKKVINSHHSTWVDKKSLEGCDIDVVKMIDANTPAEEESFLLYKICDYNFGECVYFMVNHRPYHVAGDYFQQITYRDRMNADGNMDKLYADNDLNALREFANIIEEYYK